PAPRRILASRFGLRGLWRRPMSRALGQRLGRWLYGGRFPPHGKSEGALQGAGRPLGTSLSPSRRAGAGHRIPPGSGALVGPLAEGETDRRGKRAGPAPLAAGGWGTPGPFRSAPRPLARAPAMRL